MTRLFSIDDPDHAHASEVLPWYVNGSLSAAEHTRVEQHVAQCAACRAEMAGLRELQAVVQSESNEGPVADALARMHVRLAEHALGEAAAAEDGAGAGRAALTGRAAASGPRFPGAGWLRIQWRLSPKPVRVALALQFALVLAVGARFGMPTPAADYRTLSAAPAAVHGARLTVVFGDSATQGEVRRILESLHARIVDGPNSVGALGIEVPSDGASTALQRLRASPLVRLAEPDAAAPRP